MTHTDPPRVFTTIPYWDQARAVGRLEKHIELFDSFSVFWYHLDEDGEIVTYSAAVEDRSVISFAHSHGVEVLALIANLPEEGEWDPKRVQKVIGKPEARAEHIAKILELVEKHNFDGVNIDYEFLEDSQTADFSAFVQELATALHAKGKTLAIAIHAQTPGSETRGQDLPSLTAADMLVFMTYDQHWETSDPGANAEIGWMREVLQYARRFQIPMQKISFGIPLDGYDWPKTEDGWGPADDVQYAEAISLAEMHEAAIEFDDRVQAPYFTYTDRDDVEREVWFENVESFKPRYELAKEFGVGSVALWRLGREDERIYEVIE
jgi:spore germination protein YaaH